VVFDEGTLYHPSLFGLSETPINTAGCLDDDDQYEVLKIVRHRTSTQGTEFLVRWKGYGSTDDTWETAARLDGAHDTIRKYFASRRTAIPPAAAAILDAVTS